MNIQLLNAKVIPELELKKLIFDLPNINIISKSITRFEEASQTRRTTMTEKETPSLFKRNLDELPSIRKSTGKEEERRELERHLTRRPTAEEEKKEIPPTEKQEAKRPSLKKPTAEEEKKETSPPERKEVKRPSLRKTTGEEEEEKETPPTKRIPISEELKKPSIKKPTAKEEEKETPPTTRRLVREEESSSRKTEIDKPLTEKSVRFSEIEEEEPKLPRKREETPSSPSPTISPKSRITPSRPKPKVTLGSQSIPQTDKK